MTDDTLLSLLENYHALTRQVDRHIRKVTEAFHEQIVCRKGCDACCRRLTLFPAEAVALSLAFTGLDRDIQEKVLHRSKHHPADCPLLIDHGCALYAARPIICRTHGLPILMDEEDPPGIDFCPKNFKAIKNFPKHTLLSIHQLNTTLTAVNQVFVQSIQTDPPLPERIDIADALGLFLESS